MTPTHPIRRFIPTHIFTLHDDVRVPVRIGLMRGWCASGTDENGASWSIPDGQMADANGLKLSWQCSERGVSSVKAVEELR